MLNCEDGFVVFFFLRLRDALFSHCSDIAKVICINLLKSSSQLVLTFSLMSYAIIVFVEYARPSVRCSVLMAFVHYNSMMGSVTFEIVTQNVRTLPSSILIKDNQLLILALISFCASWK